MTPQWTEFLAWFGLFVIAYHTVRLALVAVNLVIVYRALNKLAKKGGHDVTV